MDPQETTQETLITPAPLASESPQVPETDKPSTPSPLLTRLRTGWLQVRAVVTGIAARLITWRDNQKLWQRLAQVKHLRLIFVGIFLVAFVAPLLTLGATALVQYNQLKGWGTDGVAQLTSIKDLLPTSAATSDAGGTNTTVQKAKDILNKDTLNNIKRRCLLAQNDFMHINSAIANREGIIGMALASPYRGKIVAVQQLAIIGIDGTLLCDKMTTLGLEFTNSFQTSPFSSDGAPLLTTKSFADLQQAVDEAEPLLVDINAHLRATNLDDLPVNAKQLGQVKSVADHLPKYLSDLDTFKPYIPLAGWALGVDTTRHYLIQTMDRGELRPSGGFNGQWGVLSVNGGRIGKLSLADITFVDFTSSNGVVLYQNTPLPYANWFPFAPYGMRDADLSGDYPTSAQMIMKTFIKEETASGALHNPDVLGKNANTVDGDIHFSPIVIARLLDPKILGPLKIACYNETVTESNLEQVLHKYQEDPSTIAIQNKCSPQVGGTSLRKRFTSVVATALQDRVRSASQSTLLSIVDSLRNDLVTKDLEVYVTNPQIQTLMAKDHLDGALNRNPKIDGTSIIQMNMSINKQSTSVALNINENVQLDKDGTAYHDLTIDMNYRPTHFYSTEAPDYRDYVRVYVPQNAVYDGGSGFDQNIKPIYAFNAAPTPAKPLCVRPKPLPPVPSPKPTPPPPGGTPTPTPTPSPTPTPTPLPPGQVAYPCTPAQAPQCDTGKFAPEDNFIGWTSFTSGSLPSFTDNFGEPTDFASDEPGRAMFGGLVVLPRNCSTTIEIQWHVPNIGGKASAKAQPYTIEIQRQSGTTPNYNLVVQAADGVKVAPLNKKIKGLGQDMIFNLMTKK